MWVDPTGTRRRLQALTAAGWSDALLAAEFGSCKAAIAHLRNRAGDRVLSTTAANVATLYERLWWRTPPTSSTTRSRRHAERYRWVPPWRWEGVDLDDPATRPLADGPDVDEVAIAAAAAGERVVLTRAERCVLERLLEEHGRSAEAIGQLTGRCSRTIQRHRSAERRAA